MPSRSLRYLHLPYVGATPRSRDGWESLGALGHYDEDGFLYLDDCSTDCVVTGGANVYPAEVEGALGSYPGVRAKVRRSVLRAQRMAS